MAHWAQMVTSRRFCKYDYGRAGNLRRYGSENAPDYDLAKVSVPTVVFNGGKDRLADPTDVLHLVEDALDHHIIIDRFFISDYGHLDFTWGLDANQRVYHEILKQLHTKTVATQ
jgi:hypothetical protein